MQSLLLVEMGGHLLKSILGAVIVKGKQVSFLDPAVGLLGQPA
jgi:hypothetical protein